MDDVNYGIFVGRFEENFKLFSEFMTEETLQKYRRICRSFGRRIISKKFF